MTDVLKLIVVAKGLLIRAADIRRQSRSQTKSLYHPSYVLQRIFTLKQNFGAFVPMNNGWVRRRAWFCISVSGARRFQGSVQKFKCSSVRNQPLLFCQVVCSHDEGGQQGKKSITNNEDAMPRSPQTCTANTTALGHMSRRFSQLKSALLEHVLSERTKTVQFRIWWSHGRFVNGFSCRMMSTILEIRKAQICSLVGAW